MAFLFSITQIFDTMRNTSLTILLFFSLISIFAGCSIFNNDVEVEKRLSLYFEAESLGDTLSFEQDSLVITELKFSVDRFIVSGDDIEIGSSPDVSTFLFIYDLNATEERLVLDAGLGIADNLTFNSYSMFVEPVSDNAGIVDNDFYGEDTNYSMVIKGVYNAKNFEIKVSPTFDKELMYTPVTLSDVNETLVIGKLIDIRSIFINADDTILDPTESSNNASIIQRVQNNLEVEAFAVNFY